MFVYCGSGARHPPVPVTRCPSAHPLPSAGHSPLDRYPRVWSQPDGPLPPCMVTARWTATPVYGHSPLDRYPRVWSQPDGLLPPCMATARWTATPVYGHSPLGPLPPCMVTARWTATPVYGHSPLDRYPRVWPQPAGPLPPCIAEIVQLDSARMGVNIYRTNPYTG